MGGCAALAIKAMNRKVACVVVNKMELVNWSSSVFDSVVGCVSSILSAAGLAGPIWSRDAHLQCSAAFRLRVFTLLLINQRLGRTRLPRLQRWR
jgi:hypothetical protein